MQKLGLMCSVVLVVALCLLLPDAAHATMAPKIQKISILDLFQEDPSLKAQLEASIKAKNTGAASSPAAKNSKPAAARKDIQARSTAGSRVTKSAQHPGSAIDPPPAPSASSPLGRLRPQRRQKPRIAAATEPTTTTTTTESLPDPQLDEGLVQQLNGDDTAAEQPAVALEEEASEAPEPTSPLSRGKNARRKFPSLPPRRGSGSRAQPASPAVTGGNTKTESAPSTSPIGRLGGFRNRGRGTSRTSPTETAAPAAEPAVETSESAAPARPSGLSRLRNARFGGSSRFRSTNQETPAVETPTEPEQTSSDAAATGRLSLGRGRNRFSNARSPIRSRQPTPVADEPAADTAAEPDAPSPSVPSRQRNARRFPGLTRRPTN